MVRPEALVDLGERFGWTVVSERLPDVPETTEAVGLGFARVYEDGSGWSFVVSLGKNDDSGRWAMLVDSNGDRLTGFLSRPDGSEHVRRFRRAPLSTLRYYLSHPDRWNDVLLAAPWYRRTITTERRNP